MTVGRCSCVCALMTSNNFTTLTHYKVQAARTKLVNTKTEKFAVLHLQLSNVRLLSRPLILNGAKYTTHLHEEKIEFSKGFCDLSKKDEGERARINLLNNDNLTNFRMTLTVSCGTNVLKIDNKFF